jgi:hypothetical protein
MRPKPTVVIHSCSLFLLVKPLRKSSLFLRAPKLFSPTCFYEETSEIYASTLLHRSPVTSATPSRINNKSSADCASTWRSSTPRDLVLLPAFCSTQQTVPTVVFYYRSLFVSLSWLARPVSIRSGPYTDDLRDPSLVCRDLAFLPGRRFKLNSRWFVSCLPCVVVQQLTFAQAKKVFALKDTVRHERRVERYQPQVRTSHQATR